MHGIPDRETVLKDGDLLSIDAGAIIDGWHGDAAFTVFVGEGHAPELRELSRVTEESMWAGIAAVRKGNRLVDISKAIEGYIAASRGLLRQVRDHRGLRRPRHRHPDAHGPAPAELCLPQARRAAQARAGMCLAIEPMVTPGHRGPTSWRTTGRSRPTTAPGPATGSTRSR